MALFFSLSPAVASELSVDTTDSLQAAIDSAKDGDVINLARGIYKESFNFKGKAITLRGSGKNTVLEGARFKPTITFNHNESNSSIIENLSFNRGLKTANVIIDKAAPTIQNCWFHKDKKNDATNAIYIFGTNSNNQSPVIAGNIFYKESGESLQTGSSSEIIKVQSSSPEINDNTFITNREKALSYIIPMNSLNEGV